MGLFGTLVNRWPGHSITATHTTAFADLLQGQLAEAASAGCGLAAMEVSSHALAQQRVAGCRFAGAVFHQPHAGPPRLPRLHGGLFRGQGVAVFRSFVAC